jgi:hypothetical protein
MPPIPVVPFVIPLDKLTALNEEKQGLIEAILCLRGYCEEIYKTTQKESDRIPSGLKLCIDKLQDKLTLVEEEIKFITPPV